MLDGKRQVGGGVRQALGFSENLLSFPKTLSTRRLPGQALQASLRQCPGLTHPGALYGSRSFGLKNVREGPLVIRISLC